jgi:hypothetical protein
MTAMAAIESLSPERLYELYKQICAFDLSRFRGDHAEIRTRAESLHALLLGGDAWAIRFGLGPRILPYLEESEDPSHDH